MSQTISMKDTATKSDELSLRAKLGTELVKTYYTVYQKSQLFFESYGLTSQQYNILKILYDSEIPLSTSAILEQMVEKNAGVSRLIDRLLIKGLVQKKANAVDKRLIDAMLTEEGKTLCNLVCQNLNKIDDIYKILTDEEVLEMSRILQKLRTV